MVVCGSEVVCETPVCPTSAGRRGTPPVVLDGSGRGLWQEADEFDVAAVGEDDQGVSG